LKNRALSALGNFAVRIGARLGADPDYIPRVKSFFDSMERRVMMYYDAASQSRVRSDWSSSNGVPYSNISPDLKRIIARSRESSDNNGLSENIDNVFMSNVVHTGIKPEPAIVDDSGNIAEEANKVLAAGWERVNDQWDRSGHSTYYECQGLMLRTLINSGSVLTNLVKSRAGSFLPVAGQIIEPDRLDFARDFSARGVSENKPEKQTQYGIDLDEYGVPLRFYLQGVDKPISAENMSIRYKRRRPEQFIGVPWKAPVLTALWDLGSLMEDQFVSSRIRAMIAFWIHKNDAPGLAKGLNSNRNLSMEPGRTLYTNTKPEIIGGEDPVSETFDPLTRLCQRSIAIGTGLSYQILTKDLQGMNFAASRANILEDRRIFQMIQKWFIKEVCQPDYAIFVKWMFLSGKMAPLTYADYIIDPWKWSQCFWQPPGWDWVDPTKDANASIDLYKNNMTTLKEHYGSKGKNWRAELRQIAEEKAAMKDLGLQMPEELLAESKKQEIENTVRNAIEDFQ
jgi:lambda family phage portal protein